MSASENEPIKKTYNKTMQQSENRTWSEAKKPAETNTSRFPSVDGVLYDIEANWEQRGFAA